MLNHFAVQLRIIDEPRLHYTEGGKIPVCTFTGVWTRREKDKYITLYVHCNAWKDCGEALYQRFQKGDCVILEGELTTKNRIDEIGQKQSRIELTVKNYHHCTKPENVGRTTLKSPEKENIISQMSDNVDATIKQIRMKVQQWGNAIEQAVKQAEKECDKHDQ